MRVNVRIPPDGSFLSATIYEGLLRLVASGATVSRGGDEVVAPPEVLKQAFEAVANWAGNELRIANTGKNDVKYVRVILEHFGINYDDIAPRKKTKKGEEVAKKIGYGTVLKHIATAKKGWDTLGDVDFKVEIDTKNKYILVSTDAKESLQLPIFKPDRYKGLRLPEAGVVTEMFRFGIGMEAALIGLLGMGNAHVASIGGMHLFLFIDPSQAAEVIASTALGRDPRKYARALLDARDAGAQALRGLGDALIYVEAAVSRLVIDLGVRRAMRSGNIRRLNLRLVRVDEEGNTYKIYGDTPLSMGSEEAEYAEALARHLDPGKSPLIWCLKREAMRLRMKGVQPCEESTHVVNAVLWLMRYVSTGSAYFLAQYVRELINAADVAEAADKGGRAASYRRMASSLLRVM